MPAPTRFRLKSLEVTAWRGVRETVTIPLDKPLNVIYGPNGSGKSSLLTAIEWALYPSESQRQRDHAIEERRGWEIRHVHDKRKPEVTLVLTRGKEEFRIRQSGRGAPHDAPIQARYADFNSLACLHQETLRDFLIGPPAPRLAAFQRLLGAGADQDLAKAFEEAARKLDADAADTRVDALEQQLHSRLLEARRQVDQLAADARQAGLAPPWPEAESTLAAAVEAARAQARPPAAHVDAARRKVQLESARSAWLSAVELHRKAAASAAEFTPPAAGEADRLAAERTAARARLAALDRHAMLLRDAITHARDHGTPHECPVCRQPVDGAALSRELDSRLSAALGPEEAAIRDQIRRAETAIAESDTRRAESSRRRDAEARAAAAAARARQDLESALGRTLPEAEDPAAVAQREIARLDAEAARQQQALAALQQRQAEADKQAARLDLVRRVLAAARRVAQLERIRESSEWVAMLESQRQVAVREWMLLQAAARARRRASARAAENLDRAAKPISYIYSQLTRRKDFSEVVIDPARKFEVGLAGAADVVGVAAGGVLNLTDLNCLALAVTAGMAVAFPEAHDLEFLLLDDPSQSMDATVAPRLAPILARLARKVQIVVATPDAALVDALRRETVYRNIIRLEPRDPDDPRPSVRLAGLEH